LPKKVIPVPVIPLRFIPAFTIQTKAGIERSAMTVYTANGMKLVNQSHDRKVATTTVSPQPEGCGSDLIR